MVGGEGAQCDLPTSQTAHENRPNCYTGHRRLQKDELGVTKHDSVLYCDGISEEHRLRYGAPNS